MPYIDDYLINQVRSECIRRGSNVMIPDQSETCTEMKTNGDENPDNTHYRKNNNCSHTKEPKAQDVKSIVQVPEL